MKMYIFTASGYINRVTACNQHKFTGGIEMIMDKISLILAIIGALNWGGIGIFGFDTVAYLFGGQNSTVAGNLHSGRPCGNWCISLLFRERDHAEDHY